MINVMRGSVHATEHLTPHVAIDASTAWPAGLRRVSSPPANREAGTAEQVVRQFLCMRCTSPAARNALVKVLGAFMPDEHASACLSLLAEAVMQGAGQCESPQDVWRNVRVEGAFETWRATLEGRPWTVVSALVAGLSGRR